jgi:hypothetical protein
MRDSASSHGTHTTRWMVPAPSARNSSKRPDQNGHAVAADVDVGLVALT